MPGDTSSSDRYQSKGAQFAEMVDRCLTSPEADHLPGWCQECDSQVRIDTGLRPYGMARSCEEHLPLCRFEGGSHHV